MYEDPRIPKEKLLLANIKEKHPSLKELLDEVGSHWVREDLVYRFYYQSFKVYCIQGHTQKICDVLVEISPHEENHFTEYFTNIIERGIPGISWKREHNTNWQEITSPMIEAFFHAHYFLEMAVKYGEKYDLPPKIMDSGWAALLCLYDIR